MTIKALKFDHYIKRTVILSQNPTHGTLFSITMYKKLIITRYISIHKYNRNNNNSPYVRPEALMSRTCPSNIDQSRSSSIRHFRASYLKRRLCWRWLSWWEQYLSCFTPFEKGKYETSNMLFSFYRADGWHFCERWKGTESILNIVFILRYNL